MLKGKKRLTTFHMALLAWLLSGVALWVLLVSAPVESFIIDDTLGIDEGPDSEALQGTSPPFCPFAAGKESTNAPLLRLAKLHPFLAAQDSQAGAIFRLKLVRLHPPVGPPSFLLR
jgi:hypothetical protein